MPCSLSCAPRKKLPPPTTTATCTPSRTTVAIWRAIARTTTMSTPIAPPPKTSPDSLSTTRRLRIGGRPTSLRAGADLPPGRRAVVPAVPTVVSVLMSRRPLAPWSPFNPASVGKGVAVCRHAHLRPPSRPWVGSGLAHLKADESGHLDTRVGEYLLDRLLLVGDRSLLNEDKVLEEAVHAAVHDL